jgi:hypothetical protein
MVITPSGRVLIGTPPPTESTFQLDVNGTGRFLSSASGGQTLRLQTTVSAGRNYVQWANPSGDMGYIGYGGADGKFYIYNQLNDDMLFYTNSSPRMTITAAGDLSFKGRSTTANYDAVFYNDNSQLAINANNTNVGKTINFNVRNDQNAMTIASGGSVTINNLSGSGNRIVVANSGGTLISAVIGSGLAFDGTTLTATGGSSGSISGSGSSGTVALFTGSTSIGNSVITQSSSNIGIGPNTPNYKLNVFDTGVVISSGQANFSTNTRGIMIDNTNNGDESVGVWFRTGTNHLSGISGQRNNSASDWSTDLRFYTHPSSTTNLTTATERMRITSEGELLVRGSYNPYAASNRGNITLNGTNSNILGFANNSNTRGYILHDGTDIEIVNQSSGQIQFFVASGESFRVLSTGAILTYSSLVVGGSLNAFTLQTLAPTGTQNEFWRLGRALLATSSDPEDRWIRVQLGNRIYDILAIDRGAA